MAIDIDASFYKTGKASIAADGTVVTGTGTQWVSSTRAGDLFGTHVGDPVRILSVDSNTQLTLAYPWKGPSQTDADYEIQFTPYDTGYYPAVRQLLQLLTNGNVEALSSLNGSSGGIPYFTGSGTMNLLSGENDKLPIFTGTNSLGLIEKKALGLQDPNGSLGQLAALTLAARQILQTDAAGALKQIALAANKFLRTDGNGDIVLSDLGAAAISLLNLSGTAAADQLPYLSSASGASLTTLTAYARTVLDDTTGAAMFATMGATQNLGSGLSTGYQKLPSGLIIQWGSSVVTTGGEVALINYPIAYPNGVFSTVICNGDTNISPSTVFGVHAYNSNSAFTMRTNGLSGTIRTNWLSVGR